MVGDKHCVEKAFKEGDLVGCVRGCEVDERVRGEVDQRVGLR